MAINMAIIAHNLFLDMFDSGVASSFRNRVQRTSSGEYLAQG
jgi:hypothetical protein